MQKKEWIPVGAGGTFAGAGTYQNPPRRMHQRNCLRGRMRLAWQAVGVGRMDSENG